VVSARGVTDVGNGPPDSIFYLLAIPIPPSFSLLFLFGSQAWEEKRMVFTASKLTYIDYTKHKYVDNTTHCMLS
jgi:hypothetical protein